MTAASVKQQQQPIATIGNTPCFFFLAFDGGGANDAAKSDWDKSRPVFVWGSSTAPKAGEAVSTPTTTTITWADAITVYRECVVNGNKCERPIPVSYLFSNPTDPSAPTLTGDPDELFHWLLDLYGAYQEGGAVILHELEQVEDAADVEATAAFLVVVALIAQRQKAPRSPVPDGIKQYLDEQAKKLTIVIK